MARALAAEPTVLLLDEPTSSLDEASVRVIEDLLLELKKSCTIIPEKDQAEAKLEDIGLEKNDVPFLQADLLFIKVTFQYNAIVS